MEIFADKYVCSTCNKEEEIQIAKWSCACGGLLQIKKSQIDFSIHPTNKKSGLWKYEKLISSFENQRAISLGEGNTPLTESVWGKQEIFIKWEGQMPTGSYKDRGATAMISALAHLGIQSIVEDSSGNAGAAIAWYAKMAGIDCKIFAPEHASGGKLNTIIASGATLIKIKGKRENASDAALEAASNSFYASHVWCPFFIEGIKTISFELAEQFGNTFLDRIVLPLGNGSLLLGVHKGFKELHEAGKIKKLPELIAVQAQNCAPIYQSFHGLPLMLDADKKTMAEGIANANPPRKKEIIAAIKESKGTIVSVKEVEIQRALLSALNKGWMIEPTSAVSLAALEQLKESNTTVVIMSGSGLKLNQQLADLLSNQHIISD
jgi:threonine synthase